MCEIFGVSSSVRTDYRDMLREFFSHSDDNPHGWGIVSYHGGVKHVLTESLMDRRDDWKSGTSIIADASGNDAGYDAGHGARNDAAEEPPYDFLVPEIYKAPEKAAESRALKWILENPVDSELLMAHIRLATKGQIEIRNTHPFIEKDRSGIKWTLVHNGTIFECSELSGYLHTQKGETDSERILLCLTDRMNRAAALKGSRLTEDDRIRIVEDMFNDITPENKVNVLISDGRLLYAHSNLRRSLYMLKQGGSAYFSTKPLSRGLWEELPLSTLLVYKDGEQIYEGTPHGNEFVETEEKMRFLFLDYAGM